VKPAREMIGFISGRLSIRSWSERARGVEPHAAKTAGFPEAEQALWRGASKAGAGLYAGRSVRPGAIARFSSSELTLLRLTSSRDARRTSPTTGGATRSPINGTRSWHETPISQVSYAADMAELPQASVEPVRMISCGVAEQLLII
jgi:hypothetical protein